MSTENGMSMSRKAVLGLMSGIAMLALQAQTGFAGNYTYTSDDPSSPQVFGANMAKSLGDTPKAAGGTKIGVILKALSNQYWQGIESGVKAAAKDYNAYIVSPEAASNLTPALKQMQEAGVPVINTDDARIAATVYVGPSHELDGSQAADFIAKNLPDGGHVAQTEAQAGSSAAILRIKGFKDGVATHPNLTLVASVPGDWDGTKAYNATQTLLQKDPDIKAIYANNDTMAVGVAKAVVDAGLGGKVVVVGTDGIPAALDDIKNGTMAATVTPLPYYQGYWSVQAAVRLLSGQHVPPWVVAPAQLITKDNIDQFFDKEN